ncbi:MAG: DUF1571 domain-containing protein [Myxococcales bacterium]|nr:DUF1571 domain-containing protein [Myxococcales bacterium]
MVLRAAIVLLVLTGSASVLAAEPEPAPPSPAPSGDPLPSVEEIIQRAEASIAKVNDYTALMLKQERFKKETGPRERMQIKFARPFKVYVKYLEPFAGREIIFVRGSNDNQLKVHKGSFPDINVNLDPRGSMAMGGNHHSIFDFGLENTIKVAAKNLRLAMQRKEGTFDVSEGPAVGGRQTLRIQASFPKAGATIKVGADEDLWKIATRTGQDMYLILYANPEYDEPDDPDEGDSVWVPRYYGARAEFLVDRETNLPLRVTIWDWKGQVYETFEYQDLKLNPGLTSRDFDPANPAYKF